LYLKASAGLNFNARKQKEAHVQVNCGLGLFWQVKSAFFGEVFALVDAKCSLRCYAASFTGVLAPEPGS